LAYIRKPTKALSPLSDNNDNNSEPGLPPDAMAAIGRELRRMYAEIIAEGVPERLAQILVKLDEPSNEGETR
jgi:Anti-sigma factor NepR